MRSRCPRLASLVSSRDWFGEGMQGVAMQMITGSCLVSARLLVGRGPVRFERRHLSFTALQAASLSRRTGPAARCPGPSMAALRCAWACRWSSSSQVGRRGSGLQSASAASVSVTTVLLLLAASSVDPPPPALSSNQLLPLPSLPVAPTAAGLLSGQAIYLYGDYWLGMWASKDGEEQRKVGSWVWVQRMRHGGAVGDASGSHGLLRAGLGWNPAGCCAAVADCRQPLQARRTCSPDPQPPDRISARNLIPPASASPCCHPPAAAVLGVGVRHHGGLHPGHLICTLLPLLHGRTARLHAPARRGGGAGKLGGFGNCAGADCAPLYLGALKVAD